MACVCAAAGSSNSTDFGCDCMVYSGRSGTYCCHYLFRLLETRLIESRGTRRLTTAAYWQPPIIARYKSEITMDPATP